MSNCVQIAAVKIAKRFGTFQALNNIDIEIRQGEFLTLLGPSGSGKTTFLNVLAGFTSPTTGVLLQQGRDITSLPAEQRNFGMVFQGYALFPHMTILENVAFPLRVRGAEKQARLSTARQMLDVVGLTDHAIKHPRQLSGGQQQRAALARALVFRPDVLLLDEPLSALDKGLRQQMQTELRRIHREVGTTFVFVTHDQEEALALSDRIAIFRNGSLCQLDTPRTIYSQPNSRFVAEFLGQISLFRPADGQLGMLMGVRPEAMRIGSPREGEFGTLARVVEAAYHGARVSLEMQSCMGIGPMRMDVPAGSEEAEMCLPGQSVSVRWSRSAALWLPENDDV